MPKDKDDRHEAGARASFKRSAPPHFPHDRPIPIFDPGLVRDGQRDRDGDELAVASLAGEVMATGRKKRKAEHDHATAFQAHSSSNSQTEEGHTSSRSGSGSSSRSGAVSGDMPDLQFTTSSGTLLTCQNAGHVLSRYLQSFGYEPSHFRADTTYTTVPPAIPPVGKKQKPHKPQLDHQPPPGSTFTCTIALPTETGLDGAVSSSGDGWSSKLGAKQVAQFEVVKRLLDDGEIDGDLNPSPSRIPAGKADRGSESNKPAGIDVSISQDGARSVGGTLPNAPPSLTTRQQWDALKAKVHERLPVESPPLASSSSSGVAAYDHITTPSFWVDSPPLSRHEVHATLLELRLAEPHGARNDECRMLCMISSRSLPISEGSEGFADIDVSQGDSQGRPRVEAVMRMRDGGKMKKWEKGQVEMAIRWTIRMMRAQLNKAFSIEEGTAKWAIVPLVRSFKRPEFHKRPNLRRRDIAWEEVEAGEGPFSFPFELSNLETLQSQVDDAMISTRAEFSRRYYVQTIRTDLSPSSPDPHTPGETLLSTVKTYGIAEPSVRSLEHPSQPILQCELSTPAKSGGFVAGVNQPGMTGHLFIPELQYRHVLSASAFRTASTLPAFFLALDDILIVREMDNSIFRSALRPELALQALTCPSVTPLAVEKSYQRLEMLGDTLLKLVSTIDMYTKAGRCPSNGTATGGVDLETLHADRHVLVSNRSLMADAIEAGVVPFIRSAPHRLKLWIPFGWAVEIGPESDGRKATDKQHLGDKVVADVAEALIGAAYLSKDKSMDAAISAMHVLRIPLQQVQTWGDVHNLARCSNGMVNGGANGGPKPVSPAKNSKAPSWMKAFRSAETNLLGWDFREEQRAKNVMSLSNDPKRKTVFQKHKLIGDALLDYFVVDDLWQRYPDVGPAPLTHMKHSRVGDTTLAAFCVVSGLVDRLCDVDGQAAPVIQKFKRAILDAYRQTEKTKSGSETRVEWWSNVAQQNFLGDFAEAALGAIFEDSGYDLEACRSIYEKQFKPFMDLHCVGPHEHSLHPKSVFLEMMSGRGCSRWKFHNQGANPGPYVTSVVIHDKEYGRGMAETSALAVRKACEFALEKIKAFGLDNACDCPRRRKGRL